MLCESKSPEHHGLILAGRFSTDQSQQSSGLSREQTWKPQQITVADCSLAFSQ